MSSSPFMGKYPPKAGDGAAGGGAGSSPFLLGTPRRRRGDPPKAGDGAAGGAGGSSPFMGKYPPKAGDGAAGWGRQLFPIYGEVPAEGGGWGRPRGLVGARPQHPRST